MTREGTFPDLGINHPLVGLGINAELPEASTWFIAAEDCHYVFVEKWEACVRRQVNHLWE